MVITGHDHKRDAEVFGVTTYIQVDALEDGLSYAGYMNLRVKNGEIGYDFLTVNRVKKSLLQKHNRNIICYQALML